MSVINKNPKIKTLLNTLKTYDESMFNSLAALINDGGASYIDRTLVSKVDLQKLSDDDLGVSKVNLVLDSLTGRAHKGYLVYVKEAGSPDLCFFISFDSNNDKMLGLYTLDIPNETFVSYEEDLSILELRMILEGTGGAAPVEEGHFKIEVQLLDSQYENIRIISNNIAEDIRDYISATGKMPILEGEIIGGAGTITYKMMSNMLAVLSTEIQFISRMESTAPSLPSIVFIGTMEYGHSGTTDGQEIVANKETQVQEVKIVDALTYTTISGIDIPEITYSALNEILNNSNNGLISVIRWVISPTSNEYFPVICSSSNRKIYICFKDIGRVEYSAVGTTSVSTTLLLDNYTIQTTAPTADITDGKLHIVILDAEPTTEYNGYIYYIKE